VTVVEARRGGVGSRRWTARRGAVLGAWLMVVWLALWGDLNAINVAGGALVAAALVGVFTPDRSEWMGLRPGASLAYVAHFAAGLVRATARLVRIVVSPRPGPIGGVIAVDIATSVPVVVTIVSMTISLTPGTLVLATRPVPGGTRLYVHILEADREADERLEVARIERRAIAAFAPRNGQEQEAA
jgi:multicomponent Na+:H+ antiporter subunit E